MDVLKTDIVQMNGNEYRTDNSKKKMETGLFSVSTSTFYKSLTRAITSLISTYAFFRGDASGISGTSA